MLQSFGRCKQKYNEVNIEAFRKVTNKIVR